MPQLYADTTRCPDCDQALRPGAPTCPHCALPLDAPPAARLLEALVRADRELAALRDLRVRELVRTAPAPEPEPAPRTASLPPAPPTQEYAGRRGLSGADVPRFLLALAVASLLVGAMVFMAVTWERLGVGAQTALLLGVTAAAAAGAHWTARRGLRAAAEALTVLTLGLTALDALGAVSAGWLGSGLSPTAGGVVVAGAVAAVAALAVLAHRLAGTRLLVADQLGVALGVAVAGWCLAALAGSEEGAALTGALLVLVLVLLGRGLGALRARVGEVATTVTAALTGLPVALVAVSGILEQPSPGVWWSTGGVWLVVLAAAAAGLAGSPHLPTPVRALASASTALSASVALTGPVLVHSPASWALTSAATVLALAGLSRLTALHDADRLGVRLACGAWALPALALPVTVTAATWAAQLATPWSRPALEPASAPATPLDPAAWGTTLALLVLAPVLLAAAAAVATGRPGRPGSPTWTVAAVAAVAVPGTAWLLVTSVPVAVPLLVPVALWSLAALASTVRTAIGPGERLAVLPAVTAAAGALVLAVPSWSLTCLGAGCGAVAVAWPLVRGTADGAGGPLTRAAGGATLAGLAAWSAASLVAPAGPAAAFAAVSTGTVLVLATAYLAPSAPQPRRAWPTGATLLAAGPAAAGGVALLEAGHLLLAWTCLAVVGSALTGLLAAARPASLWRAELGWVAPAASALGGLGVLTTAAVAVLAAVPLSEPWDARLPASAWEPVATLPLVALAFLLARALPTLATGGLGAARGRHATALVALPAALAGLAVLAWGPPKWGVVALLLAVALLVAGRRASTAAGLTSATGATAAALAVAASSQLLLALALGAVAVGALGLALGVRPTESRPGAHPALLPVGLLAAAANAPAWFLVADADASWSALPVLAGAGLLVVLAAVRRRLDVVVEVTVAGGAGSVAGYALFSAAQSGQASLVAAVLLALGGAVLAGHALAHPSRRPLGWVASLMLAASTWLRLLDAGVDAPEAYTLPSALALVALGLHRLRTEPRSSTARALGPGLWLATVPSLVTVVGDPLSARALLLGTACLVLVMVGVRARWSQPLLVGGLVGGVLVARQAAPWLSAGPQWIPFVLAGLVLLVVAVTWEARLADARRAAAYLARLR